MRKVSYLTIVIFAVSLFTACEKNREMISNGDNEVSTTLPNNQTATTANENCNWTEIFPVVLSDNLKQSLDNIFSDNNNLVTTIHGDTLLFVICNQADFISLCPNYSIVPQVEQIDFETHCIIWGRVLTPHIPYTVLSKELFFCDSENNYKYEVAIEECVNCWTALGNLYFWGVYPKLENENVSLILKQ